MRQLADLRIDVGQVRKALVQFISDEVHKAGFERVLMGLSGGIDSALCAYLAVEALGVENVLGVLMPYKTSNPASEADARVVIHELGIPWQKIPITPMADALIAADPSMDSRRKGNIMARMRMVILFDQSIPFKGLVLGTSNKTEILLGYFTMYGDSAAALRPLAGLYKCQLKQLAEAVGVPSKIITKAPSADLWEGQTDEGELGFTYDDADQVLHLAVDHNLSQRDIVSLGYPEEVVQCVLRQMRMTAFKRAQIPAPGM